MDCQTKEVIISLSWQRKIVMVWKRKIVPTCLISAVTTFRLIQEGCDAYLATIIDTIKVSTGVIEVLVIRDFSDVFLDELPGLPPYREVDFKIEIVSGQHLFLLHHIE